MALKKVKGSLERVLDKDLQDLVRGIRKNKDNEAKYIAQCIDEIKQELKQDNISVKANAVAKLTYLQMLGYDISWAAFNVIEVMSSPKFTHKRIGYLAASQSFHEETDVLMLTTNMIRKDLSSQTQYEVGVALNGLSCFLTTDLARDLANDIVGLMASTRPYVRKKAVLIMYKIFLKFPEALRPAFPRLKEKLEDPDPGVQSAAVNVICELARKNPKNYLSLAPLFFKLMTSSTNNWVLIKIIKLFSALTPLEPRLGKKLIEPLTNLIHSTSAMSLLYECINTVIAVLISLSSGMPNHSASIQLCVQKLRILIEDSDQNLKYLGLLAMGRILKTHPKSVQSHKDLILQCLDDKDESIRLRALDLLYGMVSKKNLMEIVKKLMIHMDKAEGTQYRDELLSKIIQICSQSNYQYITNFEWYVSILVELTRIEGTRHGKLIASQMLDVAIRVKAIRHFTVSQMAQLLDNSHLLLGSATHRNGICEVLYAAAWIVGEFSEHLYDPKATLDAMLKGRVTSLPGHIQSVYVQNTLKLYSHVLVCAEKDGDKEQMVQITQMMVERMPMFTESADLEVQERACCILQLLKYVQKLQTKEVVVGEEVAALFEGELNPVAPKAQKKVAVPDGLDLDKWINEPPSDSDEGTLAEALFVTGPQSEQRYIYQQSTVKYEELDDEELAKRRAARREEQKSNPHYLKMDTPKSKRDAINVDDIPYAKLDISIPLHVPGMTVTEKYMKEQTKKEKRRKKKKKKGKKGRDMESDEDIPVMHEVDTTVDMPDGATMSDGEEEHMDPDDPHRALADIDIEKPLDVTEQLPVRTHRVVESAPTTSTSGGLKIAEPSTGDITADVTVDEKHKKKHRHHHKKKDEKQKKKDKKDKKEKKTKRRAAADGYEEAESGVPDVEENLMGDLDDDLTKNEFSKEAPATPPPSPVAKTLEEKPESMEGQLDDINFWLSGTDAPKLGEDATKAALQEVLEDVQEEAEDKHKRKKEKKHKKDKKERKEKKKKKHRDVEDEDDEVKAEPEMEAEPALVESPLPQMSSYRLLGESEYIKMTYETRVLPSQSNQVIVSVIFSNLCNKHLKSLDFNVLDSLNTKLVREVGATPHDGIKVPFQLPPGAANEGQFAFTIESISMPQKLKGTLTYMIKDDEGSTSEKIDFKLLLPISAYIIGAPCKSDRYSELLGGGELTAKNSVTVMPLDAEFSHVIAKTCFYGHLALVERVENTASFYGCSIQQHHVCLLIKQMPNNGLSIDGKSSDSSLLSNYLDEIKTILTQQ
ncbi:AP-3 complex subunit delta-1-like isoform X2 [Ptychodera flava]|uniref:AP-3 complex subunit delta-1-like isoform X2 n=1 Tax=Ptychodera flava TaxID=63121 RepID=UPI00396A0C62